MTFALGARVKWLDLHPAWFEAQFKSTWLAHLPGGLGSVYFSLALIETIVGLGFLVSLLKAEPFNGRNVWLKLSLNGSLFIFLILAYGSRLTEKYDVAGWNFLYFVGTLLIAWHIQSQTHNEKS